VKLLTAPRLIDHKPYVPALYSARHLGFKRQWDRGTATLRIESPKRESVESFNITDMSLYRPRLADLGNGYLLVTAVRQQTTGDSVVYFLGSKRGSKWEMVERPAPPNWTHGPFPCGYSFGADYLIFADALDIPPAGASDFPVWFNFGDDEWAGSTVTADAGVTHRQVRGLAIAHPQSKIMYATTDERIGTTGSRYNLWKTTNSGMDWAPVVLNPPVGYADIHDVSPGYSVWVTNREKLMEFEPHGRTMVHLLPTGCNNVRLLDVPKEDDVFMVWQTDGDSGELVFSHSSDGGMNWVEKRWFPLNPRGMDWLNGQVGMLAQTETRSGRHAVRLDRTVDRGRSWQASLLHDYSVYDSSLTVATSTEAYLLCEGRTRDTRGLRCVRWSLK